MTTTISDQQFIKTSNISRYDNIAQCCIHNLYGITHMHKNIEYGYRNSEI